MARYNPATIKGLPLGSIIWNPDFKATLNEEGLWTGSVSFTCNYRDIPRILPALKSPCQEAGWAFMRLRSIDVSNNEGDTGVVTCSYSGSVTPDYQFGDDEDSGVDDTTSSSSMTCSVTESPIEQHPKYKDVPTADKELMQELKNGRFKLSKTQPEEGAVYESKVDDIGVQVIKFTDELSVELAGLISDGILTYLESTPIYRYTYTSTNKPSATALNKVGKIYTNPKGAPAVSGGRNWLMTSLNYDESAADTYVFTGEFRLSGVDGWNALIYADA